MGRGNNISLTEEEREALGKLAILEHKPRGRVVGRLIMEETAKHDPVEKNKLLLKEIEVYKKKIEDTEREISKNNDLIETNKVFEGVVDERYEKAVNHQAKLLSYRPEKLVLVNKHCKEISVWAGKKEIEVRDDVLKRSKSIKPTDDEKDVFDKY
jgi:GTPase involved in cell partitioning and DNA repair